MPAACFQPTVTAVPIRPSPPRAVHIATMPRFTVFIAAVALLAAAASAASNPEDVLLETIGVEHEGVRAGLKQAREASESAYTYIKGMYDDAVGAPEVAPEVQADGGDAEEPVAEEQAEQEDL